MNNDLLNYASGTGVSWAPSATGVTFDNTITVPSNLGKYMLMGTGNYVTLNNTITLPSNGFSICFWAYAQTVSTSSYNSMISFANSSNIDITVFAVYPLSSDKDNFWIFFNLRQANSWYQFRSTNTYSSGSWNHITLTFSSSNNVGLYINGNTFAATAGGSNNCTINNARYYPALTNTSNYFFNSISALPVFYGGIMEFRMYNTALTQTQVNALYNSGNGNLNPGF